MKKNRPNLTSKSDKDYENLGRMLVSLYESGYIDSRTSYKHSFLKGVMAGLGGVIGATIVVTVLIWTLSLFQQVPLVGHFVDKVRTTIETKR